MRTRIEGGETVNENAWDKAYTMPWQVGITEKGGREIKAGATIICPKFVIGCAHGRRTDSLRKEVMWEVIWGSRTMVISEDAIRRDVKKKHTHRKFNDSSLNVDYDYALYELADELKLGKLRPRDRPFAVYLPDPSDNSPRPKTYVISGWGSLSNTEMVRPEDLELQAAKVSSMPWDKCQKILSDAGRPSLTKRQLCTETVGSAPRPGVGDSGGPLTWLDEKTDRVILRGIISHGNDDLPDIYADLKVKKVILWIMKKTKQCPMKTCLEKRCMTGDKLDDYTKRRFYQSGPVRGVYQ